MDVFERVREVNRGAGLPEEQITAARARLLTGIDEGRSVERKRIARRPMFVIAGAVAGVAAVTAGVAVVSQQTAPTPSVEAIPRESVRPTPQTSPTPQPTPTSGTTVTEPFPGTTPQSGQYLSIVNSTESLLYRDDQQMFTQWSAYGSGPPISALLVREVSQVYVPADRSGEWSGRYGDSERLAYFPDDQGPEGKSVWDRLLPPSTGTRDWTSPGGFEGEEYPLRGSTEWFAAFPLDPPALLDYARTHERGYEQSPEQAGEAAVSTIFDTLRSNVAPASLRQSLLAALDLSGLAEQTAGADGVVTYRMSYAHLDRRVDTISVDMTTGWVSEYTARWTQSDATSNHLVPNSVPDIRMTYSVSVVNSRM